MKTCPTCNQPIPENFEQSPCKGCGVGWSEYSIDRDGNTIVRHCQDICATFEGWKNPE